MHLYWYIANIGIAVGYYILALSLYRLLAQFMIINWQTKVGAVMFFAMCSLTHLEHAYHLYAEPRVTVANALLATHSLVIHGLQVVAVWLFLWGVLRSLSTSRRLDMASAGHLLDVLQTNRVERRTPPSDRRS